MLHCVSGRWRRRGGGAALGRGGARAPASPALTTLSGPRPPSRLGPVPRPGPVRPRCPLGRLKPVGQAAWGKLPWLRQRRLCEGRGKGVLSMEGVWGVICLGESWVWGPIRLQGRLSWRRVWEDLRVGGPILRAPWGLGSESVRTHWFRIPLGGGKRQPDLWRWGCKQGVSPLSAGGTWGFLLCVRV